MGDHLDISSLSLLLDLVIYCLLLCHLHFDLLSRCDVLRINRTKIRELSRPFGFASLLGSKVYSKFLVLSLEFVDHELLFDLVFESLSSLNLVFLVDSFSGCALMFIILNEIDKVSNLMLVMGEQ